MSATARIEFDAPEYDREGNFHTVHYEFVGSPEKGWDILRNGNRSLSLGPGYRAVRSRYCGVCSTDLARRFLSYPLPQIIGHEVIGTVDGRDVAVEINASHHARAVHEEENCPFCRAGIDTQCPERITLGIDRLPGGFAPYLLAPVDAIVPLPPGLDAHSAVLTEPFAAALQAVDTLPERSGQTVAVLGPRRLGMLLVAALAMVRHAERRDFRIIALGRHDNLLQLARDLGADETIRSDSDVHYEFDIVFDTTGSVEGFEVALGMARRILHLKSTNGRPVSGFERLTDLVVHELALVPATPASLGFTWTGESTRRPNRNVFVAPGVPEEMVAELQAHDTSRRFHRLSFEEALNVNDRGGLEGSPLPRFDLAVVSGPEEADRVIRPHPEREHSLVRPRGAILLAGQSPGRTSALWSAVTTRGLELHSSRCGDFRRATALLAEQPERTHILRDRLITQHFPLSQIGEAFAVAADSSRSIKVIVDTGNADPGRIGAGNSTAS